VNFGPCEGFYRPQHPRRPLDGQLGPSCPSNIRNLRVPAQKKAKIIQNCEAKHFGHANPNLHDVSKMHVVNACWCIHRATCISICICTMVGEDEYKKDSLYMVGSAN
jgi:hypothetical protein